MPTTKIALLQHFQSLWDPLFILREDLTTFTVCMELRIRPPGLPAAVKIDSCYIYHILRNMRERLARIHSELAKGYAKYMHVCSDWLLTDWVEGFKRIIRSLNELRRDIALGIEELRLCLKNPEWCSARKFYADERPRVTVQFTFKCKKPYLTSGLGLE